jgi:predicted ATPase
VLFTKIGLKNWKNFSEVDVSCGKRVFIIGPNASGKSNFLDALRFLRDVAQDGIAKAVATRGGMKAVRNLDAGRQSDSAITVRIDARWAYSLSFNADSRGEPLVAGEKVLLFDNGKERTLLDRPDNEDRRDSVRLTQTALEQVNANADFRELADFFKAVQYIHILPQLVRDPKQFSAAPISNDPYGRDIVQRMWNTPKKTREARLHSINTALSLALPKFKNLTLELDRSAGTPHLKVAYAHWRSSGACQDESSFSDGTLRLLTLLWSLFDGDGALLLEEPELSLHEAIIRQLPSMFARMDRTKKQAARQLFITTHAQAMLEDAGVRGDEVLWCRPGDAGTVIVPPDAADLQLMQDGLTAAEVLLPKTRPPEIEQLSLLDL